MLHFFDRLGIGSIFPRLFSDFVDESFIIPISSVPIGVPKFFIIKIKTITSKIDGKLDELFISGISPRFIRGIWEIIEVLWLTFWFTNERIVWGFTNNGFRFVIIFQCCAIQIFSTVIVPTSNSGIDFNSSSVHFINSGFDESEIF